jgi:hypothetical protein
MYSVHADDFILEAILMARDLKQDAVNMGAWIHFIQFSHTTNCSFLPPARTHTLMHTFNFTCPFVDILRQ